MKQTGSKQEAYQGGHHRYPEQDGKTGVRALECITFFWLIGGTVVGCCSRNLVLSLKLPSSKWMRAQLCRRAQRYHCAYSLSKNEGLASVLYHLLIAPISASPPFPDQELFESTLWNSGKFKQAQWNLYSTNKKSGTQKSFLNFLNSMRMRIYLVYFFSSLWIVCSVTLWWG